MALAVHAPAAGESISDVAAAYYHLTRPDGALDPVRLRQVSDAILHATRDARGEDTDADGPGDPIFVPTLRQYQKAIVTDSGEIRALLMRAGFDHARKLLRISSDRVIGRVLRDTSPENEQQLRRAYSLTLLANLDGMDHYTARHLHDTHQVSDLSDLIDLGRHNLERILGDLVSVPHDRPEALVEQRHSERWLLEARIVTRRRVSELSRARRQLFRTPSLLTAAEERRELYNDLAKSRDNSGQGAALAAGLTLLFGFQAELLRGLGALKSGRMSLAAIALQSARHQWHRLAMQVGAVESVDDSHGLNHATVVDTTRRLLDMMPTDEAFPLVAAQYGNRVDTTTHLRGFRLSNLAAEPQREIMDQLNAQPLHRLPLHVGSLLVESVMQRTPAEIGAITPGLISGLPDTPSDRPLWRSEPSARSALLRRLEMTDIGLLLLAVRDASAEGGSGADLSANADDSSGGALVTWADELSLSDVAAIVDEMPSAGRTVESLLTPAARALYPNDLLQRDATVLSERFLVLPGETGGAGERLIPLGDHFLENYESAFIKPRLLSGAGSDVSFEPEVWDSAAGFAGIAPWLYSLSLPLGLRQVYARLHQPELASRYGGLRVNVYSGDGALLEELATVDPGDASLDLDVYSCSSQWVDPATVEPEFRIYLLDIEQYARWYIPIADQSYRQDDRDTARSWYADVMCAIEQYWGGNGLANDARDAFAAVQATVAAIGRGQITFNAKNLTTLSVQLGTVDGAEHILDESLIVVGTGQLPEHEQIGGQNRPALPSAPQGGTAAVDFDPVPVALDRSRVKRTIEIGNLDIVVQESTVFNTELYSLYLYCLAKTEAIDIGLNWYGYSDDYVPPWSFEHLYGLARDVCNRALEAERVTFGLLQALESAEKEVLQASQAIELANEALGLAEARVAQQEAANEVASTQASLSFAQAGHAEAQNELDGAVGIASSVLTFAFSPASAVGSLWSAAAQLAMDSSYEYMTELAHQAWVQTNTLNDTAMAVAIAERDVAALNQQQAGDYLDFLESQFLDVGAYDYLLALSREVTTNYLDHANRLSWLAQRSLSHETRQSFDLVATSYLSGDELQDLTQAQRLTSDLEAVLATYTAGETRRRQELKWVVSLNQLSMGALQSLRRDGQAVFVLSQELLDMYYPGHHLHALQDMSVTVVGTLPAAGARGLLEAGAMSWVRVPNDGSHSDGAVVREDWMTAHLADPGLASDPGFDNYADYVMKRVGGIGSSISLSQFDPTRDRAVLKAPQGMLSSVQHLGMDTAWTLTLHRQANNFDFEAIQDVELTFWFRAAFDSRLADAQYEALVRRGRRGELQGAALVACADDLPAEWVAFTGASANPESVDNRSIAIDIADLPPWESARRVTNLLIAGARHAGHSAELTLRLCCDHDPVGHRFTTHSGAAFTTLGLPLRPADPRGHPALTAWVQSTFYDATGVPLADPAVRWVLKTTANTVGSEWLKRDADGVLERTTSGALLGPPPATANPTAVFNDGSTWTDISYRVWVSHGGGRLRLLSRHTGSACYAAEIGPGEIRLLQVAGGAETELASRALTYPADEFLRVEFNVVGQTLAVVIDGLAVLGAVVATVNLPVGTIGMSVIESPPGQDRVRFDDVEVVRLSALGAEAETLLSEPFTATLPLDWQFVDGSAPWSIDAAGHPQMDFDALANLRLKVDYLHEMVEPPA